MTITLGELTNTVSVLEKIKYQVQNIENPKYIKVKYWIVRNMKNMSESFEFFIRTREEIYSKYCDKLITDTNPQGTYYTIFEDGTIQFNLKEETDSTAFDQEMNELMALPCENIEPYKLSIDVLIQFPGIELSTDDIFAIDYLLTE